MQISAGDLHERLQAADAPLLLDVRNRDEFARWPVETPRPVDALNLPYFDFIEREEDSLGQVSRWIAGRTREVAVVCAKGGSSEFVAGLLRDKGIRAVNLDGGMIAWGAASSVRRLALPEPLRAWQVIRFGKGCLSYVIAGGTDAVVVDPQRRTEAYVGLLEREGLTLRGVIDTHLHADHVSGAPALAKAAGVPYFANPADFNGAAFPIEPVEDGRRIELGGVTIVPLLFMHAPGHTPGSLLLVANDAVLLTGDTLFVENVGRPDLGGKAAEWGRDLHRTLKVRMAPLADALLVLPAHYGGPRELRPDGAVWERLGTLRRSNPAFSSDEAAFLRTLEEGVTPAPPQYPTIRKVNLGLGPSGEEELTEMELGKNECALARR